MEFTLDTTSKHAGSNGQEKSLKATLMSIEFGTQGGYRNETNAREGISLPLTIYFPTSNAEAVIFFRDLFAETQVNKIESAADFESMTITAMERDTKTEIKVLRRSIDSLEIAAVSSPVDPGNAVLAVKVVFNVIVTGRDFSENGKKLITQSNGLQEDPADKNNLYVEVYD